MAEKPTTWTFLTVCALFLITDSIADSAADAARKVKVIKEAPIVINTVAQHYENPTIAQYELCTRSRDDCKNKCGSRDASCLAACPICPILIDQDVLVQGINDTLYRLPITSNKFNQTNIIRLTNEIRNIIETNLGNITANNQNNITIYQNKTSRVGGKFGLGYNERGPCCHLIDPQRCQRSVSSARCSHRRQRTCGSHCLSRVIRANRVVTCNDTDPNDCTQSTEYLPQPRRPGCQYTSSWPYINCRSSSRYLSSRRSRCAHCFKIPFIYILRGQMPRDCVSCYGNLGGHQRVAYPSVYQPNPMYYANYGQYPMYQAQQQSYFMTPSYNDNYGDGWSIEEDDTDDFELSSSGSGWKVDQQKCINENGTVDENCLADPKNEEYIRDIVSLEENQEINDTDYDTSTGLDYDYGEENGSMPYRRRSQRSRH